MERSCFGKPDFCSDNPDVQRAMPFLKMSETTDGACSWINELDQNWTGRHLFPSVKTTKTQSCWREDVSCEVPHGSAAGPLLFLCSCSHLSFLPGDRNDLFRLHIIVVYHWSLAGFDWLMTEIMIITLFILLVKNYPQHLTTEWFQIQCQRVRGSQHVDKWKTCTWRLLFYYISLPLGDIVLQVLDFLLQDAQSLLKSSVLWSNLLQLSPAAIKPTRVRHKPPAPQTTASISSDKSSEIKITLRNVTEIPSNKFGTKNLILKSYCGDLNVQIFYDTD